MAFDPGERTYYLSDERLRAFRALPAEDKLRWVEELATFLRMARPAEKTNAGQNKERKSNCVDMRQATRNPNDKLGTATLNSSR